MGTGLFSKGVSDTFFNTAGPVNPADYYTLNPLNRFDMAEIEMLIAQKWYFVLHAPRQVSKTSYLLALMDLGVTQLSDKLSLSRR